jgi:uncharacterized membrane protein SirB2
LEDAKEYLVVIAILVVIGFVSLLSKENRSDKKFVWNLFGWALFVVIAIVAIVFDKIMDLVSGRR